MICEKCKYKWTYKGEAKRPTCPACMRKLKKSDTKKKRKK